MNKTSLLSVIIPCYNHGQFINEAIDSVRQSQTQYNWEIIVINDGSTDPLTIEVLDSLKAENITVINQKNQGLGAARNNGIRASKGEFILPLDSDNLIDKNFIETALNYLIQNKDIDVIYTDVEIFGDQTQQRKVKDFDIIAMLNVNYIDACAIYTRRVWERNNGYAMDMPAMGHEDWEFWISAFFNGFKFEHLDIYGFKYRTSSNSMVLNITIKKEKENKQYIFEKHSKNIALVYEKLYTDYIKLHDKYNQLNTRLQSDYGYAINHPTKFYIKRILGKIK